MWYLTVSGTVFLYWFSLFIKDKSTPKTHVASWLILLIAPLFWPIVLPVSIIELMTKSTTSKESLVSAEQAKEIYN